MTPTLAQREAIAATVGDATHLGSYVAGEDFVRIGGEPAMSLMRQHAAQLANAVETIARLKVAFEDQQEIDDESLAGLRKSYDVWNAWLESNAPIAEQIMSRLNAQRKGLRKFSSKYEEGIAGITALEIGLMQTHNARVDVVIFLRTLLDKFDPDKKIVARAEKPTDVDDFFNGLVAD
ncbi:hypothetical protein TAL182_CH02231 [Rhizobium sp. TAL182]|nr:hypothetical protein TAL182_CH02231 [Rhizobium sp. TAL182]